MDVGNLKVVILLTTYNGEKYLVSQLESFLNQDFQNLQIFISDDGSTDKTIEIIENFRLQFGDDKLFLFNGPQQGFAKNFLYLFDCVAQKLKVDESFYFAYSDQDDIWYKDKISFSVKELIKFGNNRPALFCARTRLVDELGHPMGFSPLFINPPSFKNALLQNIAGGNTMVFNYKTFDLIQKTPKFLKIVSHDWWTYLLVTGAEGHVIYSPIHHLDYRQHLQNVVGTNLGFTARFSRVCALFAGRFKKWNSDNLESLTEYSSVLSPTNKKIIYDFLALRKAYFPLNIIKFIRLGLYRQAKIDNLVIKLALICKKI
jgi:glycosyltransferase involved in cell wall biosynthesis